MIRHLLCLSLLLTASGFAASEPDRPKVRTICAFIQIDRADYKAQFSTALTMLRAARQEYVKNGWEVETIRITTQPFPEYVKGLGHDEALKFLMELDALAEKEDFLLNIGPSMMTDADDPAMMDLLGEVLSKAKVINATTIIAAEDGIHWKTVRAAARMVKYIEAHSPNSQGTFAFTAAAMVRPYTPFYPASYHTGAGKQFAVGLESANVVERVFAETAGDPARAANRLSAELDRYTGIAEHVALAVAKQSGWEYMGLDPTPAPLMDVSIGAAIEDFTGQRFGSSGTMTAARIITEAVKSVRAKQVGYSGLMLPVLEDRRIAKRWSEGAVSVDALLAYSAVCATGLDTVPLPGDITEDQIARIFGDVASLAYKWKKPLTARLQPVTGKKAGEKTAFSDPYLENAVLQPLP